MSEANEVQYKLSEILLKVLLMVVQFFEENENKLKRMLTQRMVV